MVDAIVISDLHLGSPNCQARQLEAFLEEVPRLARRLVLNGDVFDSKDFRRLTKHHWRCLSAIRRMSDDVEVSWVRGNHDGHADHISCLLGVEVADECRFESGGRRVLALHGDVFDAFISNHPWATYFGDCVYHAVQWVDRTHAVARRLKRLCKSYMRNSEVVRARAIDHARARGFDLVLCGHTHRAEGGLDYGNSGCWTEAGHCTYLAVDGGEAVLKGWH